MHAIVLIALLAACGETPEPVAEVETPPEAPAEPAVPEQVQKAVTVAAAIDKEPARVDAILQENGMTRAEFEALLYDIAEDPALAEAYATARN